MTESQADNKENYKLS